MTAAPKEPRKRLKDSIEKLDLSTALAVLEEMETDEVALVLDEKMAQPGAYQIRGNRVKRNKFYDALLNSPVMSDSHDAIRAEANELNEKIKKIEKYFDEIRSSLPECEVSKLPGDVQFWSHVERVSRELTTLNRAG
ncbi:hypothetical protein L5C66_26730, partial [Pseudomonas aeruginosa]|nr:hypothetical protein [Pseudomonas aeruginosa]